MHLHSVEGVETPEMCVDAINPSISEITSIQGVLNDNVQDRFGLYISNCINAEISYLYIRITTQVINLFLSHFLRHIILRMVREVHPIIMLD